MFIIFLFCFFTNSACGQVTGLLFVSLGAFTPAGRPSAGGCGAQRQIYVSEKLHPSDNLSSRHSSRVASCRSPAVLRLLGRLVASEPAELFSKRPHSRTFFIQSISPHSEKKNFLGNYTREQKEPAVGFEINSASLCEGKRIPRGTRLFRSLFVIVFLLLSKSLRWIIIIRN